jgi:hypothetical protein
MSTSAGHVKLHRKLLIHPLTLQLPAAWFRIWIVILLRASWKGSKWFDGTQQVDVPAGSFVTSLKNLAKASGATIRQVRSALDHFEMTQMVTKSVTYHHTRINVVNWALYQDQRESEGKAEGTIEGISMASRGHFDGNSIRNTRRELSSTGVEEPIPANAKMPDWGV